MLERVRALLGHGEAGVRARAANLVGNLCRHSAFFYERLAAADLLEPLIARCRDPDRATRKFACFAIGNASARAELGAPNCCRIE